MISVMRRTALLLALVGFVFKSSPVGADIYVWRDRYGVSHYTNDLANVPAEYRGSAFTIAKDWERAELPPEPAPVVQPTPAPAVERQTDARADEDRALSAELFEAAYTAGLRAAEGVSATAIAAVTVAPVVQLVEPGREHHVVHGLIPGGPIERRHRRARDRQDEDQARAPFQGPAGPPPLGAAGPPPFQPRSR